MYSELIEVTVNRATRLEIKLQVQIVETDLEDTALRAVISPSILTSPAVAWLGNPRLFTYLAMTCSC